MQYAPRVAFDPQVERYLQQCLGATRLQHIKAAIPSPSLRLCLRVNNLRTTPDAVVQQLRQQFPSTCTPWVHRQVPQAVIVPGNGPLQPDYQAAGGREVVINRLAAEAVLKGAHVYAPGLLAASAGIAPGDLVAVSAGLELPGRTWSGWNRGAVVVSGQGPTREGLYLGVGRAAAGRRGMFRAQEGLVVEMQQRVFELPSLSGVLPGQAVLQALPCVVAAAVLDPTPGSRVLDLCAAPGGKTTLLAQIMQDQGEVVALDRTAAKAAQVQALVTSMGLTCVTPLVADSTQLYQQDWSKPAAGAAAAVVDGLQQEGSGSNAAGTWTARDPDQQDAPVVLEAAAGDRPGASFTSQDFANTLSSQQLQPGSFDYVLLDAPCSALGLRPRLLLDWTLPRVVKLAAYQRALWHSAVHLLKPGGTMVYCTCTINPGENEGNVRWALDKWPQLQLVEQTPVLGGPGLTGQGLLTAEEAALVQRFDPGGGEDDTMGFFIAKLVKHDHTRM